MKGFIQKAAVLGSGVMGSAIAAHLANVGIPVLLLDLAPKELTASEKAKGLTLADQTVRNRLSEKAIQTLLKQKPAPLTVKENAELIEAGNMADDMERLSEVDWVIEAVVENIEVKKSVFEQVERFRSTGTIVSSNTSGISIHAMTENRTEDFKAHFLGTHFFNPPRYLKLLELIPTDQTDPDVLLFMKTFAEETLGKGVVEAKDTPNFIANRIGTYGLLVTVKEMMTNRFSIGEIDAVTGPMIGRPKSATFRTLDVVGLDTFLHVAKNVYDNVEGPEQDMFTPPAFMKKMAEKGWVGSKAGQGFYKKLKTEKGSEILEIHPETFEYSQRKTLKTPATEKAKQAKKVSDKLKALVYTQDDAAGQLVWRLLKSTLLYAAEKCNEIAHDIKAVDDAMKWGFGWELGPFETWDAIGVEPSIKRMEEEGEVIPTWVKEMIDQGCPSFYKARHEYYHQGECKKANVSEKTIFLKSKKENDHVIMSNRGASLIDIGDGVACLEFHSPHDAIGLDVIQMMNKSIDEVDANYKGLVIANEGKNFSVGANLMMILMEAQDENYVEIDIVVRQFQQAMMRLKYANKPVVAAPHGMTLGGGAEVCLSSARMEAALETYMGLVETGVGLIPGGGGNKELYLRHIENMPDCSYGQLQAITNRVFETIAMAKVSTSAAEARQLGFLTEKDQITLNEDHRIYKAKQEVIHLYGKGYCPPKEQKIPVVGEAGYATMLLGAQMMKDGGHISAYDFTIAKKLAFVLAGGRVHKGAKVSEQYLLHLEREAFLSLVGEPKTQQRMQHMLAKGKPLRN